MSTESPPAPAPVPTAPPKEPADAVSPLTIAERTTAAARALHAAGVVDLDAGLALLEQHLEGPSFDAVEAAKQLKQLKPVLFRAPAAASARPAPSATMSPAPRDDTRHELVTAAERAAATGDRNAVLTYMRTKRSFV